MIDGQAPTDVITVPRAVVAQLTHAADELEALTQQALTVAHTNNQRGPVVDQRTLVGTLRTVALLVHEAELSQTAGTVIAAGLCPAATADAWRELVHAVGTWRDLDTGHLPWEQYDEALPAQIEPRQAVAADLAEADADAALWALLNPGQTRCTECVRRMQPPWKIGSAVPGGRLCGTCLTGTKAVAS